jgi:hypothetical protein
MMSQEFEQESVEVKHLSPSKIEAWFMCGESFRFRYVEKIPETSGGVMIAGRVVHSVIEFAMNQVKAGKPLPGAKDLDDLYLKEWESQIKEEEEKESFIGWRWDDGDPEESVKKGFREIIPAISVDLLPTIRPKYIEETVKVSYPSEIGDFLVWGQLDLMDEDGVIWDWKTTKDKVSNRQKEGWFQFAHYAAFAVKMTDQPVTPIRKTFLVRGRKKKPIEIVPFELGPTHRDFFARQAATVWKAVKSGVYPLITESWHCSEKFCSFFSGCMGDLKHEAS